MYDLVDNVVHEIPVDAETSTEQNDDHAVPVISGLKLRSEKLSLLLCMVGELGYFENEFGHFIYALKVLNTFL